ncbi:hypothetical protein [Limnohabitans parvus]|uniref:hypothetical protein n=1 Tax=Limnohabitans parvus TaxID=540061 RepID=UPI00142E40AB|nr:hypothetical protein [Limnohabitans parvus]
MTAACSFYAAICAVALAAIKTATVKVLIASFGGLLVLVQKATNQSADIDVLRLQTLQVGIQSFVGFECP